MTLEEQLEHQVRIVRARMPGWISAIFIAGFAFSALGVTPLSAFGFAYDHFGQQVDWHAAADGLATVEALRNQSKDSSAAADLETLAGVLRIAARKQVPFALVLRLWERDNMQVVCTRETRQGNFW
jgi:hypothetical protein